MGIGLVELTLLVITGLVSAIYAKLEDASSLSAAIIGTGTAVIIYLITR